MKTFQEAIEYIAPSRPAGDRAAVAEAVQHVVELNERYRHFAADAANHPAFVGASRFYLMRAAAGQGDIEDAMLSMFMMGLQVGMEMEKAGEMETIPARRWWQVWR